MIQPKQDSFVTTGIGGARCEFVQGLLRGGATKDPPRGFPMADGGMCQESFISINTAVKCTFQHVH